MTPSFTTNNFMLLYREIHWEKNMTPDQVKDVSERIMLWYENLLQRGIAKTGHPLHSEGRILSGRPGQPVTDGPFIEGKEAIGGFVWITADSLDAAAEIAKGNPALAYGLTIEVREVVEECPIFAQLKKRKVLEAVS